MSTKKKTKPAAKTATKKASSTSMSTKKKTKPAAKTATKKASSTSMSTEIVPIPITKILPMASNRRVDMKSPKMIDLIASVTAHGGNLVPGIARRHPERDGFYELASGARRLAALRAAGVEQMALTVSAITDADMVTIRCTENAGREDLTPLEEARDVADMLAVHGSLQAVAEKLGRNVRWVARRARLTSLIEGWQTLAESEGVNAGIGQLEMIAALPEETQTHLFEQLRHSTHLLEAGALDRFRSYIANTGVTNLLSCAPWRLDDETLLPQAGACSACPKRSSCAPELFTPEDFGDLGTRGKKTPPADRCLEPACWSAKTSAYTAQAVARALELNPKAVRIATRDGIESYEQEKTLRAAGVIIADDIGVVKKAKKTDEGAVPAIVMVGPNVGDTMYVVLTGAASAGEAEKPRTDKETLDDKRAALERRRWAFVAEKVRETIDVCQCPVEFTGTNGVNVMIGYVLAFGTMGSASRYVDMECDGSLWDLAHAQAHEPLENVGKLLFHQLKPEIIKAVSCAGASTSTPDFIANVRGAAVMLGLDPDALKLDADVAIPEPKSWAKLGNEQI